jgi:GntR family transcriptional regulator / MocR family aminotransferase
LVANLRKQLGPLVEVIGDEAGMHVTVTLQNGIRDLEIAERAARLNLSLWPLSPFYLGEALRQGFILGFGATKLTEIPNAVRKLRNLLA